MVTDAECLAAGTARDMNSGYPKPCTGRFTNDPLSTHQSWLRAGDSTDRALVLVDSSAGTSRVRLGQEELETNCSDSAVRTAIAKWRLEGLNGVRCTRLRCRGATNCVNLGKTPKNRALRRHSLAGAEQCGKGLTGAVWKGYRPFCHRRAAQPPYASARPAPVFRRLSALDRSTRRVVTASPPVARAPAS